MADNGGVSGSTRVNRDAGGSEGFADALRQQTHGYAAKRKADAVRIVSDVAEAIRGAGADFDRYPQVKPLFEQAALGVEEFAEGINRRTLSEVVDEVDAAVRRRPGLTAAAAVLTGFALFHLLRTPGPRPVPRSRAIVPAPNSRQADR